MSAPVVWAVVHDLGRSGVPVALERMVRWQTRTHPDAAQVHVIAAYDGPLHHAFARCAASVTTLEPAVGRSAVRTGAVALTQAGWTGTAQALDQRRVRHRIRHLPDPDVVLLQGAGAWRTFTAVAPCTRAARVVVHLHELDAALGRSGLGARPQELVTRSDAVLAVSAPVVTAAHELGAAVGSVPLVPGSVDEPTGGWDAPPGTVPATDIVSIGTAGWRKGSDRATAVAHELRRRGSTAAWHWIGEREPSPWSFAVGAEDLLIWHPTTVDPWSVVADPAVVVIPSREDPLPLVALEAGARARPVVATRTGGLPALLADGRGQVVDGHDLVALADAVEASLADPDAARERGEALRAHVREQYATEVVGPVWLGAVLGPA